MSSFLDDLDNRHMIKAQRLGGIYFENSTLSLLIRAASHWKDVAAENVNWLVDMLL